MANNFVTNAGSGGATFASDDVGGIHYPYAKLAFGADDTATIVTASAGLPVAQQSGASFVVIGNVADGAADSGAPVKVAGTDGTNVQTLSTTASGHLQIHDGGNVISVDDGAGTLTVDAPVGTPVFVRLSDGAAAISTLPVSGTFWQATQPVSGTVAVTNADLTTLAGAVRAEDVASADAHTGIPAMAVRKATPANTSGTDGDYEMLQVSAGRLWASATIDAALPAGTNAIGKLAANDGVDIGDTTINNASGASAVNIQDGGNSITVDGTFWQATQPVSGTVSIGNSPTVDTELTTADLDTGAGTDTRAVVGVVLAASGGGALAPGDATKGLKVQVTDGSGTQITSFGGGVEYAEDTAHSSGDTGKMVFAVRRDADTSLVDATGDYAPLQVNAAGSLKVAITAGAGSGGTSLADNAGFTPGSTSFTPIGGEVDDTGTTDATENSAGIVRMTTKRAIHVNLRDASGSELSVGGGTQYDEDTVSTAADKLTMAGVVRKDTAATLVDTDGDRTQLQVDASGRLHVNGSGVTQPVSGTVAATQSGTWTVQPGNTANTTAWKVDGSAVTQPVSIAATVSENLAQVGGNSVSTAASGTQKVGVVGNTGATLDAAIGAATAPTNQLVVGSVFNSSAPAPTTGQSMSQQADQAGNLLTAPGIATATLSAWNSGTALNATQTVFSKSGVQAVLVHLVQTTTLSAGAVTAEVTYDNTNWITISADCVIDPTSTTLATVSLPYTVQASTNKPLLLLVKGAQGLRLKLSTQITGSGSVTPNYALLPYAAVQQAVLGAGSATIGTVTLGAGTAGVGKLTANSGVTIGAVEIAAAQTLATVTSLTQMNGQAIAMGTGVRSAGTQRVTIATDDVVPASQSGTWSVTAANTAGDTAHDGADAGNPVKVGGRARSSEITAVANNDRSDFMTDLVGKQIILPYCNPENMVSGAITTAMTATTSTSLIASPGAGLRNYITTIICSNAHATVGTDIAIQDGSGGTTLLTIPAAAVYGGAAITLPTPLRQPTANTALFCANVTTGASTKVSAVGYKGA